MIKENDLIHGFRVKYSQQLDEIGAVLWRMEYEKNGADLVWLERKEEDNKTFAIAFKTIPSDDTGVFHILEHSVLCGSKKYPVKEPFVELIKGSMATFLNAFTFPDKTMYPISSRNAQDFLNLMDVYMDAVFHPLSIYNPNAFRQEGWHYETDGDTLSCNGVVYNEMKGAYASPDSVLIAELNKQLFPDNCYGYESGGHPDHITELTYESYLENHKRFYHPSNSRIVLDGDIDLDAALSKLDEYLCEYDKLDINAEIAMQKPVSPKESVESYEIGEDESVENKTILADGWVFGDFADTEKNVAFSVLSSVIAGSNEAPLTKALLDNNYAEDVELGKMDGIQQIFAYLIVRNTDEEKKSEIRSEIRRVLEELAEKGLNHEHLHSVLSRMEFSIREKEYGDMPKGLVYAIAMMESWLYNGDPAQNFSFNELFASLRKKVDDGWFEQFLREVMLENPHHAEVCLVPSATLGAEKQKAEQERLSAIKAKLTADELGEIKRQFEELRRIQEAADTEEQLATLPKLSLSDISPKGRSIEQDITDINGITLLHQPQDTNGITYVNLYFSLADFTNNELSQAEFLTELIGESATEKYTALEIKSRLQSVFGRFTENVKILSKRDVTSKAAPYMQVSIALLQQNKAYAAELIDEVLNHTIYSDTGFVYNYLRQAKLIVEQDIAMVGNKYAAIRASASTSEYGSAHEAVSGISMLRFIQNTERNYESIKQDFCQSLAELSQRIFTKARLIVGVTGELDKEWLESIVNVINDGEAIKPIERELLPKRAEGFVIPAEIAFAVKSCNMFPLGISYTGLQRTAAQIMTFDYLWNEVRVKGGAYGTGMKADSSGNITFTSFRDPNPKNTMAAYDHIGDALRAFCESDSELEKYIISTIAASEPLLTPRAEGALAETLYLSGLTCEDLQKLRDEILATNKEALKKLSYELDELVKQSSICVIGSSNLLKGCGEMLEVIETISQTEA